MGKIAIGVKDVYLYTLAKKQSDASLNRFYIIYNIQYKLLYGFMMREGGKSSLGNKHVNKHIMCIPIEYHTFYTCNCNTRCIKASAYKVKRW